MGCAGSKSVNASAVTDDVYRPPPASIAVFDISTIEEPWLITATTKDHDQHEQEEEEVIKKPTHVLSLPILDKLETAANGDGGAVAPDHQLSWSEVSKALEDLKPSLDHKKPTSFSNTTASRADVDAPPPPELTGRRPVKENSFLIRDRLEREGLKASDANRIKWRRPDPLEGYPERSPPANPDGVVLYTTSLRGVRRTFEDCEWARRIVYPNALEAGVEVDERDVSLHGEFLKEMRGLVEEGEGVPRLFVMGRYVGGIERMVEVNEDGKMREMMRRVRKKKEGGPTKGAGWVECEGCGGARFVPCMECSGSCKVVVGEGKELVRCESCNENGLVMCPICH